MYKICICFHVRDNVFSFSQGQYVKMACSRLGSRVLEAVWKSSSVSHRQNIAQELGNSNMTSTLTKVMVLVYLFLFFCFLKIAKIFSPQPFVFFFSWM